MSSVEIDPDEFEQSLGDSAVQVPYQRLRNDIIAGTLRPAPNDRLEIRDDPRKGRGIFARVPITPGTIIENAPVILISPEHCALLDRTIPTTTIFAGKAILIVTAPAQWRSASCRCATIRTGRAPACAATSRRRHST